MSVYILRKSTDKSAIQTFQHFSTSTLPFTCFSCLFVLCGVCFVLLLRMALCSCQMPRQYLMRYFSLGMYKRHRIRETTLFVLGLSRALCHFTLTSFHKLLTVERSNYTYCCLVMIANEFRKWKTFFFQLYFLVDDDCVISSAEEVNAAMNKLFSAARIVAQVTPEHVRALVRVASPKQSQRTVGHSVRIADGERRCMTCVISCNQLKHSIRRSRTLANDFDDVNVENGCNNTETKDAKVERKLVTWRLNGSSMHIQRREPFFLLEFIFSL